MSRLGLAIRTLRKRQSLTQGQLALYADIDRSYVSQIENGYVNSVGSEILSRLAQRLNTTTDYLLGLTASPWPPGNPGPTEQESHLLRIFRSLHEDQRGMVLAYSQWLAERFK